MQNLLICEICTKVYIREDILAVFKFVIVIRPVLFIFYLISIFCILCNINYNLSYIFPHIRCVILSSILEREIKIISKEIYL